jgi:ring-1,2-phenylacetyl-CoA epoxidase subunit PaaE
MAFGLFKKKKKEVKSDDRYHWLTIKEVQQVASETVNVVFEKPEKAFEYKPGQFITLIKEIHGKKLRRAYSLCTSPFVDEFPTVTVKRVPGGLMSNHVNDHFKAGDTVEVMEPMGRFTIDYDVNANRKAIFFGGGSGITPLFSILKSVLVKEPNSQVALVYGNRSEEFVVFKEEFQKLKEQYGDRFQVVHILEEDPSGFANHVGRPTPEMISQISNGLFPAAEAEIFICGPEPMMQVVKEGVKLAGVGEEMVHMESFEAGKTSPSDINTTEEGAYQGESDVTIILNGESHEVRVKANDPILDAGLDAGLDMPYSCQSGLCTACRAKCLEGTLDQEDAHGLTPGEVEEGYVLLCVGKPKSSKIKLEVG